MDVLLLILRILLALLLYAFLGAVFWMLWRDLRQAADGEGDGKPERIAAGQLIVLESAEGVLPVGASFPLEPVTSIGRAPTNTLPLPDVYASAHHTLLAWREGQWWLEDQDSRNGTLLNDVRISSPVVVSSGDVIGVGRTRLKLELGAVSQTEREQDASCALP